MGICMGWGFGHGGVIEARGVGAVFMRMFFAAVPSRIGGADLADIERLARVRPEALPDHGPVRFRKLGEHHAYNPLAVPAAQKAAHTAVQEAYRDWPPLSSVGQPPAPRELINITDSR